MFLGCRPSGNGPHLQRWVALYAESRGHGTVVGIVSVDLGDEDTLLVLEILSKLLPCWLEGFCASKLSAFADPKRLVIGDVRPGRREETHCSGRTWTAMERRAE